MKKITDALNISLFDFFEGVQADVSKDSPKLAKEDLSFLKQMRTHTLQLSENDRVLLLALVRKFSSSTFSEVTHLSRSQPGIVLNA